MVFAVSDVNGASLNEDAMRTGQLARARLAIGSIAALAGTGYSRDNARAQVNAADDVVLSVGNIEALVGSIRHAFWTVQRITGRPELCGDRGTAVTRITQLAGASNMLQP